MLIKRLYSNEEGGLEFTMALTPEQAQVLINFAVLLLVQRGLIQFTDEVAQKVTETPVVQGTSPSIPEAAAEAQHGITDQEVALFTEIMKNAKPGDLPQA